MIYERVDVRFDLELRIFINCPEIIEKNDVSLKEGESLLFLTN